MMANDVGVWVVAFRAVHQAILGNRRSPIGTDREDARSPSSTGFAADTASDRGERPARGDRATQPPMYVLE
jgi:hypothetical protein